jgi:hypothetical protein
LEHLDLLDLQELMVHLEILGHPERKDPPDYLVQPERLEIQVVKEVLVYKVHLERLDL